MGWLDGSYYFIRPPEDVLARKDDVICPVYRSETLLLSIGRLGVKLSKQSIENGHNIK